MKSNKEVVRELLEGATNPDVVNRLVAPDATYMSLTFDDPELKKLMPWAGTHQDGREGILSTFQAVHSFWTIEAFEIRDIFGEGEDVAVFGSFTVFSVNLRKRFVSPFSVHAKLRDGLVTYLQYMEDTFGTGSTFRSAGTWEFSGDPTGAKVTVGD